MSSLIKQYGVTLYEVIVALSVIAILAGMAIPSMASMLAQKEVSTAQDNIAQSVRLARTIAMSKGTITSVSIVAASNVIAVSVLDGTMANKSYSLPGKVNLSADSLIVFDSFGFASITGASSVVISAPTYGGVTPKKINISQGGQIDML